MDKSKVLKVIEDTGLVAVIRGMELAKMANIAKALVAGGVKALEITMNSSQPLKMIEEVKSLLEDTDVIIGAGTVLDPETARAAILAGAEFIFAPNLNLKVIELCRRYDKLVMPGVMTPTEIVTAWEAGADLVKVFPAQVVGPEFIKSVKGPLNHIKMIPTGGINLDNAADYIKAGAIALGVGGSLLDKKAIANEDYEILTERARAFQRIIEKARNQPN
ncbi:2-dehydro-3-deoxyphosphogluconate aldolase [Anoxybacter fermentans]|uniref:2-dehydro-3-deoxyphosphogluconate aldolase n=1 Tax=Anoxybacter fermentans TaxID=1323375 RepID=A0A3Q9HPV8_9FIRM|nr:bifunctional 2-keto-4-hydroxyglutarate aldolase/2-keto-3-deoxy-6-phosphogluconate aldolase [Anoxybacter fermentans]AZR71970.1 2-dehydro-3-deoxyphosphogluconate aldolase [Anoxybacter fermentans]